ncbi:hypothetical protein BH20ACT8_BH20ACT8_21030 [soil metagenome]
MKARTVRTAQRIAHLAAGVTLLAYFYGPLRGDQALRVAVTVVALPLLVLSGVAMWQAPRLRRMRTRALGTRQSA